MGRKVKTACCGMSVNNWTRRFETLGMPGLETKAGRGRKAILGQQHLSIVAQDVKQERHQDIQSLFYSLNRVLNNIGKNLFLNFKPFQINLN